MESKEETFERIFNRIKNKCVSFAQARRIAQHFSKMPEEERIKAEEKFFPPKKE